MISSDVEKSSKDKERKTVPTATQEQSSATSTGAVNAEWPVFQAFSSMPGHSYLASTPQTPPYMWGMQHVVPHYGAPPPYIAMYPHHGGMYAHPHMAPGSYPFRPFPMSSPNGPNGAVGASVSQGTMPSAMEANGKFEGKEKLPIKRLKGSAGSLNMVTWKKSDTAKPSAASANEMYSKSEESGSEASSDGSDANSQNGSRPKSGDSHDSHEAEASQNGSSLQGSENGGSCTPKIALIPAASIAPVSSHPHGGVPDTGMEYWGAPSLSTTPVLHGKIPSVPAGRANVLGARDAQALPWLQDERELKRQRRKQSNRESARRSRLRKQAECDELAQRAEVLNEENATLRAEVHRISSEYEKLASENTSLKERVRAKSGNEATQSSRDTQNVGKDTQ